MPSSDEPTTAWAEAYPSEAFDFVQDGVEYTVKCTHGDVVPHEVDDSMATRHVDGRQLSVGLRDFAIRRYGILAPEVLRSWNINRTDDFGRIVYAMIDGKELYKSDEDRIEDFFAVYEFGEAFGEASVRETLERIRDEERIRG